MTEHIDVDLELIKKIDPSDVVVKAEEKGENVLNELDFSSLNLAVQDLLKEGKTEKTLKSEDLIKMIAPEGYEERTRLMLQEYEENASAFTNRIRKALLWARGEEGRMEAVVHSEWGAKIRSRERPLSRVADKWDSFSEEEKFLIYETTYRFWELTEKMSQRDLKNLIILEAYFRTVYSFDKLYEKALLKKGLSLDELSEGEEKWSKLQVRIKSFIYFLQQIKDESNYAKNSGNSDFEY